MPSECGPSNSVTIGMVSAADLRARLADAVREEQARGDGITIIYDFSVAPPSTIKSDRLRKLWAMMRRFEVRLPKYGEV
jgi:hypothetical protein